MVTKRQKEIVYAHGKFNENRKIVDDNLKVTRSSIDATLTRVFYNFKEELELIDGHFPVFEGRFKKYPDTYTTLRRLAEKMKGRRGA